jgi:tetratricopeptide (TPR) repeat protein
MSGQPPSAVQINAPVTNSVVVGVNTGTITNIVQVAQVVTSLHQLRAPLEDFVGRERELAALVAALAPAPAQARQAAVCGMGGQGKTELALRSAAQLREQYPDAQLFLSLRATAGSAPRTPADGLRDTIRAFEPQAGLGDDVDLLAAQYRACLDGKRCLLVLDDAPDDRAVQPFMPPAGCALLVTSRTRLTLGGQGLVVELGVLSQAEARNLLLNDAPQLAGDLNVDAILEHCAGLPLAVRVAAAVLATGALITPQRYLERLDDDRRRPGALRFEHTDVLAVLGAGHDHLAAADPQLAGRWRMLGVCPAPFEAATAASIWQERDADALDDALGQLLRRSLLAFDRQTQRFRVHELLRDVAAMHRSAADSTLAHLRHAQHYLSIAREAQRLYEAGHAHVLEGLRLFDASWDHLRIAGAWLADAASPDADDLLVSFALVPYDLVFQRALPAQQQRWFEATRAAARRRGDDRAEGRAQLALANSHAARGDLEQAAALTEQGLALARSSGDQAAIAIGANDLAVAHMEGSRPEPALVLLQEALGIYRALGDRRREGQTLVNVGLAYEALRREREALQAYAQGLKLVRGAGDMRTEVLVLGNLGLFYQQHGDLRRAAQTLERAARMAAQLGDRATELMLNWQRGELAAAQGQAARARALIEPYVAYLRAIGDPDADTHAAQLQTLTDAETRTEKEVST